MDAGQCDSKISYDYKYILLWQDITGKMEKRMQRVTIKDIASETGFSIATVSRALSKRGGVKDNTQEYIRETAINMGYKINSVAQSLSRKKIVIGVVKPQEWSQFYGQIHCGIMRELERLIDFNVTSITVECEEGLSNDELLQVFLEMIDSGVNAVIICTGVANDYSRVSELLHNKKIPFAEVGNAIFDDQSSVCVRVDSYLAGRLAGEYMREIVSNDAEVGILIGSQGIPDHVEKVCGFIEEFHCNNKRKVSIYETQDLPENAYKITKEILEKHPRINGIYVGTVNSEQVCKCIEEFGTERQMKLVITDIQPSLGAYVDSGIVSAAIFQNTIMQGRLAVKLLYDLVSRRKRTRRDMKVTPHIVLRSNFQCYLDSKENELSL